LSIQAKEEEKVCGVEKVKQTRRGSLRAHCKTKHEKVTVFAYETMPRVFVVTNFSLKKRVSPKSEEAACKHRDWAGVGAPVGNE
jgi:hypothetical protein